MRVKLGKHGNSLGFVVPASVVREEALEAGQEYELTVAANGGFHLLPVERPVWRPDLSIDELLAGLPEGPLKYEDIPEYRPVGRELDW
ncbi:transcriptional regulator/antitoxin MazE [Deinococcus sp. SDU3-2]|uniref:Transcriptional regulator/antitoxin MazE n=1 Tax=Deinococcus terrestris TaxID=2651870 RepID=A0A7X1NWT8_9DEIO|nr:transcriptional regulator/antitoxin MazE [Deinococcus terrestris]MPY67277.1 transcriptional regulator/antitoxin MazE [Deinococcus terrestris]